MKFDETLYFMKRRQLLTNLSLGTASISVLSACQQQPNIDNNLISIDSQPSIRWRMATSWPKSLDILFGGAESLCSQIDRMTNGRFIITPYAAGEIVDGFGVLDAVSGGTVECGHTASYYYFNRNPALAFGSNVPFGLTAEQQNAWLYYGGGLEFINQVYADFNVISFPAGNTGVQMGGWFKNKINTVTDLNGLKMRIPGFGSKVMSRLGVEVQVLPADQIVPALIEGKIDAVEWNNPYDDEKIGLNHAARFYYYPGWWEPGATYELQVNLEQWNKLPREYREILKTAAGNLNIKMLAQYNAKNGKVLQRLVKSGTQLLPFSETIIESAYYKTVELYEEYASRDQTFRDIYQQWQDFRQQVYRWTELNELNFAKFMIEAAKIT